MEVGKNKRWERWLCESRLLCALPAWPFVHADMGCPKLRSVVILVYSRKWKNVPVLSPVLAEEQAVEGSIRDRKRRGP